MFNPGDQFSHLARIFDLDYAITEKFADLLLDSDIQRQFSLESSPGPLPPGDLGDPTPAAKDLEQAGGVRERSYQQILDALGCVNKERMCLREKNVALMKRIFLNFSTENSDSDGDCFAAFLNKCLFLNYEFLKKYLEKERESAEQYRRNLAEKDGEIAELKNQLKKLEKELKNSRNSLKEYLATGKCENMLELISNEIETQRNNSSPAIPPKSKERLALPTSTKEKALEIETCLVRNFNDDIPATPNYSAFISDAIEIAESRLNLDFNPDILFSVDPDTPKKRKGSANNVNPLLGSSKQGDPMRSSLLSNKRKSLQNILQQPNNVKIPLLGLDLIEEKAKDLGGGGAAKSKKGGTKLSKTCSIKTLESKPINHLNPEANMKKSLTNRSNNALKKNGKTPSDQQGPAEHQKVKSISENKDPAGGKTASKKAEANKKKAEPRKEGK